MSKVSINKGDLIWGFVGQMHWSSGLVVNIETVTHKEGWILAEARRTIYGVLWSNGTFSEHFRHELSLPHEVAKEA